VVGAATKSTISIWDCDWSVLSRFGPNHATFDHNVARFASFAILGGMVDFVRGGPVPVSVAMVVKTAEDDSGFAF
jgi:hypothetical protein